MIRIGKVDFSFYCSGRDRFGDARQINGRLARFGMCWFYLRPHFHSNGGSLRKRQVLDMTLQWLCFGVSLTIWGNC